MCFFYFPQSWHISKVERGWILNFDFPFKLDSPCHWISHLDIEEDTASSGVNSAIPLPSLLANLTTLTHQQRSPSHKACSQLATFLNYALQRNQRILTCQTLDLSVSTHLSPLPCQTPPAGLWLSDTFRFDWGSSHNSFPILGYLSIFLNMLLEGLYLAWDGRPGLCLWKGKQRKVLSSYNSSFN
jgi:hypothetical protein